MKKLLFVIISIALLPTSLLAGQVCLERGTGKLIEYQSRARVGTCTKNAINSGYPAATVEERTVTDAQWAVIREQWIDGPNRQVRDAQLAKRQLVMDKIKQALSLTDQEIEDAFGR